MDYENLIKSVLPVIQFHKNETCFPENLDFYIENSALYQDDKKILDKVSINQLSNEYKDSSYVLKNDLKEGSLERAVLYVRVQELETQIRLAFFVFFSFNPPYNIGCFKVGDHHADMERFSFYLNKNSHEIEKVYLGAHGSKDGLWLNPDEFDNMNDTMIIYCSLGSHAFYNTAKRYWRYFGLLNDHTNQRPEEGLCWVDQKFVILTDNSPEWQNFQGNLGYPDNCNVPRHRGWDDEPKKSTSGWKRFFGCC